MADQEQPTGKTFLQLGERQQAAVAAAMTILATVIILCAVFGLAWAGAAFLKRFSHVFLPLAVGAVGALVFNPYYRWLRNKLRMPAAAALAALFISVLVPIAAALWFFGAVAVDQVSDMITKFPEWWEKTVEQVQARWPQVKEFLQTNPWGQRLQDLAEGQKEALFQGLQVFGGKALTAGAGIFRAVGTLVAWAVFPVYLAFFLMADWKGPRNFDDLLPFLKPDTRKDAVYLVREFVNIVVAFFRGQLIIAFLQGLLFAIGFSLVGLKYGFVLGLVLGFLNIIPYLGA